MKIVLLRRYLLLSQPDYSDRFLPASFDSVELLHLSGRGIGYAVKTKMLTIWIGQSEESRKRYRGLNRC